MIVRVRASNARTGLDNAAKEGYRSAAGRGPTDAGGGAAAGSRAGGGGRQGRGIPI